MAPRPGIGSLIEATVVVTLPAFVAVKEYSTLSPGLTDEVTLLVLAKVTDGVWTTFVVTVDVLGTSGRSTGFVGSSEFTPGVCPASVTVFARVPRSRSACVTA